MKTQFCHLHNCFSYCQHVFAFKPLALLYLINWKAKLILYFSFIWLFSSSRSFFFFENFGERLFFCKSLIATSKRFLEIFHCMTTLFLRQHSIEIQVNLKVPQHRPFFGTHLYVTLKSFSRQKCKLFTLFIKKINKKKTTLPPLPPPPSFVFLHACGNKKYQKNIKISMKM